MKMKQDTIDILCCPQCRGELSFARTSDSFGHSDRSMVCRNCGKKFTDTEGFPDFLGETGLKYSGKREKIVRTLYAKVYTPVNNFLFLFCGGAGNARREVLSRLDLQDSFSVLETGMGAGENYLWMNSKAKNLRFYGIDIQKQMMVHCMENTQKWGIQAELFRADATNLPFKDEKFDVVFHLGAINLFPDKGRAIEEMIRVSRPGTRIVIADETDKAARLFNVFTGANDKVTPPVDLIPGNMINKSLEIIWRGYGYLIQFTKPYNPPNSK